MPISQLVRLVDVDPDLAEALDGRELERARRHLVADVAFVPSRRPLSDLWGHLDVDRMLGLLVVEGLLLRRVHAVGRAGVELLGPGDVVRPWQIRDEHASLPTHAEWRVCQSARLAILDEEVQAALVEFPSIVRQLFARSIDRANTLAINLALAQLPRVEDRLVALFWHFADRFGRVDRDGVIVPLRLSHSTLSELVYARRPSVTTALTALASRGELERVRDRGWLLRGSAPAPAPVPA